MPRKRHVSRNLKRIVLFCVCNVMPRKRHVSRNDLIDLNEYRKILSCLVRGM